MTYETADRNAQQAAKFAVLAIATAYEETEPDMYPLNEAMAKTKDEAYALLCEARGLAVLIEGDAQGLHWALAEGKADEAHDMLTKAIGYHEALATAIGPSAHLPDRVAWGCYVDVLKTAQAALAGLILAARTASRLRWRDWASRP